VACWAGAAVTIACVLTPLVAGAQSSERAYVQGIVGAAFAAETDVIYGGSVGVPVANHVELFGEIGRLRNAIGPDLSDRLAASEAAIRASTTAQFGQEFTVDFDARVPTWYGIGGIRYVWPVRGTLRPYVEAAAGFARLDPEVHLSINSQPLDAEAAGLTGIGPDLQRIESAAAGGAGVSFTFWRIRVEGGYRYMRIFGDDAVNVHGVHAGVGWRF
jgi:opacity protein-like surface antigen